MKTKLKILVVLFCFLVYIPGAAGYLEISETETIIGNGTFDKDFRAQTAPSLSGQKLTESIVPTYPLVPNVTSYYHSDFELVHTNNSSIYYESVSEFPGVKHYLRNDNFELGVCTGFYFIGKQKKSFSFESSPSLSEALSKSEVEGRSVVRARVINRSHYHQRTVDTFTWLEGNYTLDWAFLVIDIDFPEAWEDDYLGCP